MNTLYHFGLNCWVETLRNISEFSDEYKQSSRPSLFFEEIIFSYQEDLQLFPSALLPITFCKGEAIFIMLIMLLGWFT